MTESSPDALRSPTPYVSQVKKKKKDGLSYPSISHLLKVAVTLGNPVPFRVRCWPLRNKLWVITTDIPGSCWVLPPVLQPGAPQDSL